MKGSEAKLVAYMQGTNKHFVIPVYQRNYAWKTENCKQLYNDLVDVVKKHKKSHFFGSIVSLFNQDGTSCEFFVIDGQQRLTTISILLLAMYTQLKKKNLTSQQKNLEERIYEEFLVDKWQSNGSGIKLKPVEKDEIAYQKLFEDADEHIRDSNFTINYNYFCDRLQKNEVSVDALFDALHRLEIINIILNNEDNPQRIFESLNATGLALSEGDKIRNFVLMGLSAEEQKKYYTIYWAKIEHYIDGDVSLFVRDYLSVKKHEFTPQGRIYITFKAFVEEQNLPIKDLLEDLLTYAKLYEIIIKAKTKHKKIQSCLSRLQKLEIITGRSFFMQVLHLWYTQQLSLDEVADIFLCIENYFVRRFICDLPSASMNKIFVTLHKEISKYTDPGYSYKEKLAYILLAKKEKARFPNDAEFAKAFSERQIYRLPSKNKIYLFERIENYDTLEDKDVYHHFTAGEYSIEHIMPQHLTPAWIKELGPNHKKIHEEWLHRIANLTITAYNAKYSNSPFLDKKQMKNGFAVSGIRMNALLAQYDAWTLQQLKERDAYLKKRALEIWPLPTSSFVPRIKQLERCSLDEENNLTHRSIARFSYKGTEQLVTNWVDMYERVLRLLYAEDKSVLLSLAYKQEDDPDYISYIRNTKSGVRAACEIDIDVFVEKYNNTYAKIALLRRLFALHNIDPAELVFYLRDECEKSKQSVIKSSQA